MSKNDILRKLPQVDELLNEPEINGCLYDIPHDLLVNSIREVLTDIRANVINDIIDDIDKNYIIGRIISKVKKNSRQSLRHIINATGVILHTNLGRSILSSRAKEDLIDVAVNYTNLEYDIKNGTRGDRQSHIENLIKNITGAEAAMVVNNNAAATVLVLSSMAKGKEVIISRGELVEIGGSFRIPEVMSESGAILKEVGATNKTKLSDYRNAYDEFKTSAIMKVHKSNYKIVGFTEEASVKELKRISNELQIPLIYDMGNGLFVDLTEYGIDEPNVKNLIDEGADIVLFSGDKLLGGPQAGIIIGKEKYISQMKKHPLARAFRVDKFTLAALSATLYEYYDEKKAKKNIPVLDMITKSSLELKEKAIMLSEKIRAISDDNIIIDIEEVKDQVGGGTAPDVFLSGYAVSIEFKNMTAEKLERRFRECEVPVIVRISHDKILLDVRTIKDDEIDMIVAEMKGI